MYPSLVLPLLVAPLRHSHQPIELAGRCCIGFINSAAVSRLVVSPHVWPPGRLNRVSSMEEQVTFVFAIPVKSTAETNMTERRDGAHENAEFVKNRWHSQDTNNKEKEQAKSKPLLTYRNQKTTGKKNKGKRKQVTIFPISADTTAANIICTNVDEYK
jgi:hypothetical protein